MRTPSVQKLQKRFFSNDLSLKFNHSVEIQLSALRQIRLYYLHHAKKIKLDKKFINRESKL